MLVGANTNTNDRVEGGGKGLDGWVSEDEWEVGGRGSYNTVLHI